MILKCVCLLKKQISRNTKFVNLELLLRSIYEFLIESGTKLWFIFGVHPAATFYWEDFTKWAMTVEKFPVDEIYEVNSHIFMIL